MRIDGRCMKERRNGIEADLYTWSIENVHYPSFARWTQLLSLIECLCWASSRILNFIWFYCLRCWCMCVGMLKPYGFLHKIRQNGYRLAQLNTSTENHLLHGATNWCKRASNDEQKWKLLLDGSLGRIHIYFIHV